MQLVFLTISFLLFSIALACLISFEVSDGEMPVVLLLPPSLSLACLIDCILAGLSSTLHIPTLQAAGISLFHLLVATCSLCFLVKKDRILLFHIIKSVWKSVDSLIFLLLALFTLACGVIQFGPTFNLNFASTDPATHFRSALLILDNQNVDGLYYTHYLTSLVIDAMRQTLGETQTYKAFIIAELLYYNLNVSVFYSLVRMTIPTCSKCVALIVSLLYAIGYPLNNMVFGFSYLGMGTTLLLTGTFFCVLSHSHRHPIFESLVVAAHVFGLVVCYSLFVPIAILSIIVALLLQFKSLLYRHIRLVILSGILGTLLVIVGVIATVKSGAVDGLSAYGYTYTDFVGSFILVAPISIFGFLVFMKHSTARRAVVPVESLCAASLIVTFAALCLYLCNVFSAYYYYKFYYVLWGCAFLCAANGLSKLVGQESPMALSYITCWIAIVTLSLSGLDRRISLAHPDLSPAPVTESLTGCYIFNKREMLSDKIPDQEVELWAAASDLTSADYPYVPLIGSNIDVYWYEAQTHQRYESDRRYFFYWLYDTGDWSRLFIDRLSTVRYCAVLYSQDPPESLQAFLQDKRVVFQNEAGYIVELANDAS